MMHGQKNIKLCFYVSANGFNENARCSQSTFRFTFKIMVDYFVCFDIILDLKLGL